MPVKLILIRHGKAEDRDLEKSDELRELTLKGKEALEQNARYLVTYLKNEKISLISSPFRRALQTAEILGKAGLGQTKTMDFVATGNLSTLKRIIRSCPDTVCVIIGHTPFLEEWIYAITSQQLDMEKGSACQIEITDLSGFTGFVTWQLDLKEYPRLLEFGSFREAREHLLQEIAEIIGKNISVILEHRELYLREPEDIESVHKLRVKIRQFRSLVSFFKPFMKKAKYREIQDILRTMAQECAYLRELDVLIKDWRSRSEEFARAGMTGEHFLAILEEERRLEQERLYRVLEEPAFARKLGDVESVLLGAINLGDSLYTELRDLLMETLNIWHDEIEAGYEAIHVNDLAVIHALRISAKKMRYVMEVFELDKAEDTRNMHQEIKRWQEVLGNITDANRNSEAVLEIAARYPDAPIQDELKLFNELQQKEADRLYSEFFGITEQVLCDSGRGTEEDSETVPEDELQSSETSGEVQNVTEEIPDTENTSDAVREPDRENS